MALKIETNQSATAYHVVDGPVLFPYAVDAQSAIARFPLEWSDNPWALDATANARKDRGLPPQELTPDEQAALDQYHKDVAAAADRLAKVRAKQAEDKVVADQIAADEALVASPPPRPDPNARRPFGRKGPMTPAEQAAHEKKAAAATSAPSVSSAASPAAPAAGTIFAPAATPTPVATKSP